MAERATKALRRSITSRMSKVLSHYGLENAVSGGKYDELKYEINSQTGFWAHPGVATKPPRLIVHFNLMNSNRRPSLFAFLPDQHNSTNFAVANTAHRSVGGICTRILPVFKIREDEILYVPYPQWEWLLWYCFVPSLENGTSGELFSKFNPDEGTFEYKNNIQSYVDAGLVTLNQKDETLDLTGFPVVSYDMATRALRQLIRVETRLDGSDARPDEEGNNA